MEETILILSISALSVILGYMLGKMIPSHLYIVVQDEKVAKDLVKQMKGGK